MLGDQALSLLFEVLLILRRPLVAQVAVAVVLAALIVQAVADHHAQRAIVHRVIRVFIEERGLDDRGGHHDLVGFGGVIRISRLRRREPLCPVNGFAELGEPILLLEPGRTHDIADEIVALDGQRRIITPSGGVPDLDQQLSQLDQRLDARGRAHLVERGEALPKGGQHVADHGPPVPCARAESKRRHNLVPGLGRG